MAIWDALLGERIDVELTGADGRKRRRRVRAARLDKLRAKGWRVRRLDRVPVHVLDAFQGPSETQWVIGTDVTAEVAEQYTDPETGALYAVVLYEGAEPRATKVTTRGKWEELRASMDK